MDLTTNYGQLGSTDVNPQSWGLTSSGAAPNITPQQSQQGQQGGSSSGGGGGGGIGQIISQIGKPLMGAMTGINPNQQQSRGQMGNAQAANHNGIMSGLTNLFGGNGVSPTRPQTPQLATPTSGPLAGQQPNTDFVSTMFQQQPGQQSPGGWPGAPATPAPAGGADVMSAPAGGQPSGAVTSMGPNLFSSGGATPMSAPIGGSGGGGGMGGMMGGLGSLFGGGSGGGMGGGMGDMGGGLGGMLGGFL